MTKKLYFDIPPNWWILFAIMGVIYAGLYLSRRGKKDKNELKMQMLFALVETGLAFTLEFVGVSLGLWTYFPANWPISVWMGYFAAGLVGYQLIKKLEEVKLK